MSTSMGPGGSEPPTETYGASYGAGYADASYAEPSYGEPQAAPPAGAHSLRADPDYSGNYGEALPEPDNISVGQIVGELVTDISTLMRQEFELAKAEVRQEVKKSGKGVGMLAGAAMAGFFLLLFASVFLMYLFDLFLPLVLAALIVALLWGGAAALLATRGRKLLRDVNPKPDQTLNSIKEDVQWAKTQSR